MDTGRTTTRTWLSAGIIAVALLLSARQAAVASAGIQIAVEAKGRVYLADFHADFGKARIRVFSSSGARIATWGKEGTGKGEFFDISGMIVGADGRVYTMEMGRVQAFSASGRYLRQWRLPSGTLSGKLALGKDGAVYVTTPMNPPGEKGVLLKLWPDNTRLQHFTAPPQVKLGDVQDIAVDAAGTVYLLESRRNEDSIRVQLRIHRFTLSGDYLGMWARPGAAWVGGDTDMATGKATDLRGVWQFRGFEGDTDMAVDDKGYVYLLKSPDVVKLDSKGRAIARLGLFFLSPKWPKEPQRVEVFTGLGELAETIYPSHMIEYHMGDRLISRLGPYPSWPGPGTSSLVSIAIAPTGEIYLLSAPSEHEPKQVVRKLAADGKVLAKWNVN